MRRLFLPLFLLIALAACDSGDPAKSQAGFGVTQQGLVVRINDTSTGARNWRYTYGDLSPEEFDQNPIHFYTRGGEYTIRQTACPNSNFNGDRCGHASALVTVSELSSSTVLAVRVFRFFGSVTGLD